MSKSYITENTDIGEMVRKLESNFISGGGVLMSKYVVNDLYEDINKIYAYLDSKHITGEKDSKGRDKPFFNIVTAARNIYYRATDLDRKNMTVTPSKMSDTVTAFIATVHLHNWMKRENFGAFLNDWGMELAAFNSSVVKFIENKGKLHPMVVPWSRLIVDQVDFDNNPKIETLELTEAQLRQRVDSHGYDAKIVEKLCAALVARQLTDNQSQDQRNDYVKLYEVHGNLPLSFLTGKETDEDKYEQQMHVITYLASKEEGQYDDFTLVSGREKEDPYMLTSLLPAADGSISLNGSVKNLFEAQWMMNHTAKAIKDQLDLASKLVFQTADVNFVGRNVLTAIETGDIMVHRVNMPLTQVQNNSHDIGALEGQGNMWKALSSEINGVSESMLGNTPPSGTAWRQVNALLNESHSLFELMTENKALCAEQMLRRFVIPHLKKQMDTSDEIAATLEAHSITKIDSIYIPNEAVKRFNQKAINDIISGNPTQPFDQQKAQDQVKQELSQQGNQRFFKPSDITTTTWKEVLKDLEWEFDIDISGEAQDKNTVLTTLNTALGVITNPNYQNNPTAQLILGKILSATGEISPIELSQISAPPPAAPSNKISESMSYKDVPSDVQRQMEQAAGFKPSTIQPTSVVGGAGGLPVKK